MPVQITDAPIYTSSVYHGGRGGAGNYRKVSPSDLVGRVPSAVPIPSSTSSKLFFGGRGGAGNAHPVTERAMFSFDEELERDRLIHEHHAPVYSIGRGGKGNLVSQEDIATRSFYSSFENSASSSPRSSTSSNGAISFSAASLKSGADRLWERVRRA